MYRIPVGTVLVELLLLVIGLFLKYMVARRRFNRRNVAGIETFKSFERSVLIRVIEKLVRLVGTILAILGALGLVIEIWRANH